MKLTSNKFNDRVKNAVYLAWSIFSKKVGGEKLRINKEASMQLHFAYILQQILPLVEFSSNEKSIIELEKGLTLKEGPKLVDLAVKVKSNQVKYKDEIFIEMKCYKNLTSSGGIRGATDIFMKDLYEDLRLLESYILKGHANFGILLVLNDLERLVFPKNKNAKCWDYDISNGTKIKDIHLNTPIGGKAVSIKLEKEYNFQWEKHGDFWFMILEGK